MLLRLLRNWRQYFGKEENWKNKLEIKEKATIILKRRKQDSKLKFKVAFYFAVFDMTIESVEK